METKLVQANEWPGLARALTEQGWWLADLCGVDRLNLIGSGHGEAHQVGVGADSPAGEEGAEPAHAGGQTAGSPLHNSRFEVVAQFLHHERRERTTVHVVADGDPPAVPSITELWPSADFMEREAFDLIGIVFHGHPNLKRIMLPDEWEGHPLRKDYGVGKIPVEFVPQPFLQFDSPHQQPNSAEAGVKVDRLGQPQIDQRAAAGGMSHFDDTKNASRSSDDDGRPA
jgi:NADH:ubiquinone oxidoreductase subunit C